MKMFGYYFWSPLVIGYLAYMLVDNIVEGSSLWVSVLLGFLLAMQLTAYIINYRLEPKRYTVEEFVLATRKGFK